MMGGQETRIRVGDHETTVNVAGAGTDRTLVLVHAALLDRHLWGGFTESLTPLLPEGWRVIGYDLRGHGTAAGAPPITGIGQLADDLGALLDAMGVAHAHVAGLSLGGTVAQSFALAAPERTDSLVVVGSSSVFPRETMVRRATLDGDTVADRTPETLVRWFGEPEVAADGPAVRYARDYLARTTSAQWSQTWLALGGFDVRARLPEITAPTLAVAGSADTASPPAASRLIADSVRCGQYVVLDAAHLIPLMCPYQLAERVAGFLPQTP